MKYITLKNYNNISTDYRGIWEAYGNKLPELKGKRTMMLDNNGGLAIESVSFEIIENFEQDFIMNNKQVAEFQCLDDWSRCIFTITLPSSKTVRVVFLEECNKMYSISGDDEPDCPLKEEYQIDILKS